MRELRSCSTGAGLAVSTREYPVSTPAPDANVRYAQHHTSKRAACTGTTVHSMCTHIEAIGCALESRSGGRFRRHGGLYAELRRAIFGHRVGLRRGLRRAGLCDAGLREAQEGGANSAAAAPGPTVVFYSVFRARHAAPS